MGLAHPGNTSQVTRDPSIIPIPCLKDNYAYLVFDPNGDGDCVVVDPSECTPVSREVEKRGLRLRAILNTHHHWDHIGGNRALLEDGELIVVGHSSESDRIPGLTLPVMHGEQFEVAGLSFRVRHVPGHTRGAVAYSVGHACFTGDTLFCAGCGRLFEGTPAQMHESLTCVLGELSDETLIYAGHEYTECNLQFAESLLSVPAAAARLVEVKARRAHGTFCASATMAIERASNPFLRCHLQEMQEALGVSNELDAFTELRRRKDAA